MKIHLIFGTFLALAILGVCCARAIDEDYTVAEKEFENLTDERIVGGQIVDISVYPHQISLRVKSILKPENAFAHSCGGSIITDRIIVTASHCVIGKVASQYQVVAGANYRRSADGVALPIQELIMHENYNSSSTDNDIALLVLAAPMPINNYTIKPIELAEEPVKKGATATITGWGTVSFLGSSSNYLQDVKIPVVSNEECNKAYGEGRITDAMFCVGLLGIGGKDACQGDSGGPVVINGKLAGIVSWGNGCARAKYPGVYTNVPYFRSWLREQIELIEAKLSAEELV